MRIRPIARNDLDGLQALAFGFDDGACVENIHVSGAHEALGQHFGQRFFMGRVLAANRSAGLGRE